MLDSFKRWVSGEPGAPGGLREIVDWSKRRGVIFKRLKDEVGFVIEGTSDGRPWRMEWGQPQRSYIQGYELRLRMELNLPRDLQMLLLSRPLMETLVNHAFEQLTSTMQTKVDVAMPVETRWVSMFPKVTLAAGKELRRRFVAVAWSPPFGEAWINGPVSQHLEDASHGPLATEPPLVLMTLSGRIYLRLELPNPDVSALVSMLALFETAAAQALLATEGMSEDESIWQSTSSTAWQTLLQPEDPKEGSNQG